MTLTTPQDREIARRAMTLAVVCVEQRVEALRAEWRSLSDHGHPADMPGLEQQIEDERAALRWLTVLCDRVYRTGSADTAS